VAGVVLADGSTLTTDQVLLAAGCWSGQVGGLPPDALPPVRPVKGQILRIQGPVDPPVLQGNVRGLVRGRSLYLVPRASGRIVVGATMEEMGFDTTVTVDGIHRLLHDAAVLVPGLLDLELAETLAGLRPGSPDNEPVIGRSTVDGLVVATGHHRNGILLTPVTADAVVGLLGAGPAVPEVDGFGPERFLSGTAA
jgi:glycine oxidase